MTTRRQLWLDTGRYEAFADTTDVLPVPLTIELLLRAWQAGHVTVDIPDSRGHTPEQRGRVVIPLSDTTYKAAESVVGQRRMSALVDALIAAYMDGTAALAVVPVDPKRLPKRVTLLLAPPPAPTDVPA
ncbi:hypothetical protein [Streptomyces sp. NBC_00989]|uniref:hypothetical protein n=1 Tax=Streptomyces sp. NBC_00989 TaxID=2903705 RepID=UPI0038689B84|nr:hypothetical protein OG714_38315 [Streptomyces sp. NBC_00989]